jgi:cell division cycle 20, cofactor of APC complex
VGKKRTLSADRFIPNRGAMDLDLCRMVHSFDRKDSTMRQRSGKENGAGASHSADAEHQPADTAEYNAALAQSLLISDHAGITDASGLPGSKILAFRNKAPPPPAGHENPNRVLFTNQDAACVRRKTLRHIPQQPERILDAPSLLEDFYLNLLDWGSNNVLAVALADKVYLWNATTGSIEQLCETTGLDDCVTSVSWLPDGAHLAVGTNRSEVQIWDADNMKRIRTMTSHSARVGALAWNGAVISSGSRDSYIHNNDVRIRDHHVATLASHTQEVCGLKWSPNGSQLASGGNDNTICIWDNQHSAAEWTPKFKLEHHVAAVKALAWCPWQTSLLATGGGTADRHLRFWNTTTGACVNSIDTNSQVCSIVWSPHERELVTSHGFSQNQLTVWKYPTLARMAELRGHTSRVLHTAISPDGQTVVSGAADETLRFWRVFAKLDDAKTGRSGPGSNKASLSSSSRSLLRGVNIR